MKSVEPKVYISVPKCSKESVPKGVVKSVVKAYKSVAQCSKKKCSKSVAKCSHNSRCSHIYPMLGTSKGLVV
jgi:hypothetical protein